MNLLQHATNSNSRISMLLQHYSEGGFEAARITEKKPLFYITELEDMGPMYIVDDFGNSTMLSFELMAQQVLYER
jgi:hypothetical protein